jgi:hypothetical protein
VDTTADDAIEQLKRRFRVSTDQELAERLKVGRSTVTSWRRRGSIPERYARLTDYGTSLSFPPDMDDPTWTEAEQAACELALVRLIRGWGADNLGDYTGYLRSGPFVRAQFAMGLEKAVFDLYAKMDATGIEDPLQCARLMVYEELYQGEREPGFVPAAPRRGGSYRRLPDGTLVRDEPAAEGDG